ncbi:MAG TPA: integrase [Clostridia bacterium]|nr:integrase [Clostridia bacterium]
MSLMVVCDADTSRASSNWDSLICFLQCFTLFTTLDLFSDKIKRYRYVGIFCLLFHVPFITMRAIINFGGSFNMSRARQLPSGAWRVQIYLDGKRESITRDTEDEANYAALELKLEHKRKLENVTVGEAIDAYINARDEVLSPTTIAGYRKIRANRVQDLMDVSIRELSQQTVQDAFNREARRITRRGKRPSPKTQADTRGLLASALGQYGLQFKITTSAAQKQFKNLSMPDQVWEAVKGTPIELPVLLAMWLSFSMSEVRGIDASDIKGGILTLRHAVVDVDGERVEKSAMKEYDRARQHEVPLCIMALIEQTDAWKAGKGKLVTLSGQAIYKRFVRRLEKFDLPHMSFHQLRAVNASVMLMLGVPDKYAMERGGWRTDTIMKSAYQNTFSPERKEVDKRINAYFDGVIK